MRAPRIRLPLAAMCAAGLVLLMGGGVALSHGRGVRTEARLRPYAAPHDGVLANAGVTGRARTRTRDGRTEVRVQARGLARDTTVAARLTNGRCADFGAGFKLDPSAPATRDNGVWLDLRADRAGEAGDRISVRPLPAGHIFSIVVYAGPNLNPGARIACGDLRPDQ
jgi:hypothetical protein